MNLEQSSLLKAANLSEQDLQYYRLRTYESNGLPVVVKLDGKILTPEKLEIAPFAIAKAKKALGDKGFYGVFYDTRKEQQPRQVPDGNINISSRARSVVKGSAFDPTTFGKTPDPKLIQEYYSTAINGVEYVFGAKVPETANAVTAQIWQVYFQPEQQASLLPGLTPYNNEDATKWLESGVIANIYLNRRAIWQNANYVGVLSHRWPEKYSQGKGADTRTIAQILSQRQGNKVVSLWHGLHLYRAKHIQQDDKIRPGTLACFERITELFGWQNTVSPTDSYPGTRWNAWVATPEVFEAYCEDLTKLMEFAETDSKLKELINQPAPYKQGVERNGAEQLQKVFGQNGYTLHPFVGELFFAYWIYYQRKASKMFKTTELEPVKP